MRSASLRLTALALLLCLVLGSAAADVVELPIDFSGGMPMLYDYKTGMLEYEDPSIRVTRDRVESAEYNCTYYVAYITIANPTQLRTRAANTFDSNATRSAKSIARQVNAVLAINGDYFSARTGVYVLRQGQVFRDAVEERQDILLIDEDGDFHILLANEDDPVHADKTTIGGKKVINAFDFGPALVKDGEKVLDPLNAPKNVKPASRAQRIAIAQTGPLEYMVVCCAHYGLDLDSFTDLIMSLGDVKQAYNLDGGNSVQFLFMGTKVNNTQAGDPRMVTDIIYFASAYVPD